MNLNWVSKKPVLIWPIIKIGLKTHHLHLVLVTQQLQKVMPIYDSHEEQLQFSKDILLW